MRRQLGITYKHVWRWLRGEHPDRPGVVAAGVKLAEWLSKVKSLPSPPPPAVSNFTPELAAEVERERVRLQLTKMGLARLLGIRNDSYLGLWLRGEHLHMARVIATGEKLAEWLSKAKSLPSP